MMDRIGSFALVSALVLLSALHIVSAPNVLNLIPAALGLFGIVRLVTLRGAVAEASAEDMSLSPAVEA